MAKKITSSEKENLKNLFIKNPVFYSHLIDLAPEAIAIHNKGKIVYVNPAARKLFSIKNEKDVIGKSVMDFIHPDSIPLIQARIKKMLSKKRVAPFALEKFIDTKGNTILAETKAVPFAYQGETAIIAIMRDVTKSNKEEEQQLFLNSVSKLLSSSIEYTTTLKNVIGSIVPSLADYSRLILVDDKGQVIEEVSYHVNPQKLKYVNKLYDTYRNSPGVSYGVSSILSKGKPEIFERVDEASMKKFKDNKQLTEVINKLGLTSYMGVPLKARNKVIGALTFSSIKKDRIYTKNDLRFAEEVAQRIASAIENSRLYTQAQKTIEAEQRLAAIVEFSDDAIVSKRLDGTITSWNKSAQKVFGYTAQEAIGKNIRMLIPKELQSEENRIIHNIKNGKHIEHYETVRVRKDGKQIFVSLTISAIKDNQGKIIGASKIARDISDKKKIENELAHLASLVESSSDAIWSSTLDNTILSWNKGAEEIYGYTAKEMIGKNGVTFVVPPEKVKEREDIIKRVSKGEKIQNLETTRRKKDGSIIDVSMTVSSLKDPQGKIIGISAIVRNITEQKEQEKLKDEFISMASHELKTPITSMKMFLDILSNSLGDSNPQAQSFVKRINDQTNKMKDLVNDLLDVSRIGTGKLSFNHEKFFLDEAIKDTIESIQPASPKHMLKYKDSISLPVYGDKFRIYQVITNLLNNAIKYSPQSNKVIISTKIKDRQVIVSVKDFGIGIPKDKQHKIFEKLYQVTDPQVKTFPGLGMGLYISREIINGHNGKMWVKSEKGKGSTFYFSLTLDQK
ncbi:MAG TPA: PAS domain S-box protein [Candidatus Saccharimonadales bacterium]|nr:PAS domain S-box protein [Candidatus Saccharimonadales bacterium]